MKSCPYCYSDIHERAVICAKCGQHLSLVEALSKQVALLQKKADQSGAEPDLADGGVALSDALAQPADSSGRPVRSRLVHLCFVLLMPLGLLLLAHGLTAFVYDTRLIYQRLIAIVLPLPFGLFVRTRSGQQVLLWGLAAAALGVVAVLGMSAINAWVDKTPLWPEGMIEWRDAFEFAVGIALSFVTGMLLRRNLDSATHRSQADRVSGGSHLSASSGIKQLSSLIELLQPLVAGAVAIYAGLKALIS